MKFICFDLEGPLSPQDNAYELMKRIPDGEQIFEVISRYDDLLALEGRKGYEPGETLALIVPFLIYHDISEESMREASERATLVDGARDLVAELVRRGWWVGDITTCYEQYGYPITQRIGIPSLNVACTRLRLDTYRKAFQKEDFCGVGELERDLLMMRPEKDDEAIRERLDSFYWGKTASAGVRAVLSQVKPLGGERKLSMLREFALQNQMSLDKVVVVGDSITDSKMLEAVNEAGGLAVAFNANKYALPQATVGLASTCLSDLLPVLDAWEKGGREAVKVVVKVKEVIGGVRDRDYFHWVEGVRDLAPILQIHYRIRRLVREGAAKLG